MFSGSSKEKFKFSLVVRYIGGVPLTEASRADPRVQYRVLWSRGKKAMNKGETDWMTVTVGVAEFKKPATLLSLMNRKKSGEYEPKALKFVVEENSRGTIKSVGSTIINLADFTASGMHDKSYAVQNPSTGKAIKLNIIVTSHNLGKSDAGNGGEDDDLLSQMTDHEDSHPQVPAPQPQQRKPQQQQQQPTALKQLQPQQNLQQSNSNFQDPYATPMASARTVVDTPREQASGAEDVAPTSSTSHSPLTLSINRLSGPGLASCDGTSYRVGYKVGKETFFTDFGICSGSTVAWSHVLRVPVTDNDKKMKITVQQGPATSVKDVMAFAVDVAKLQSIQRKECAFGIKLNDSTAKLYLGVVQHPQGDTAPAKSVPAPLAPIPEKETPQTLRQPATPAGITQQQAAPAAIEAPSEEPTRRVASAAPATHMPRMPTPPPPQSELSFNTQEEETPDVSNEKHAPESVPAPQKTAPKPSTSGSAGEDLRQQLDAAVEENNALRQKLCSVSSLHGELEAVRNENETLLQASMQKDIAISDLTRDLAEEKARAQELEERAQLAEAAAEEARANERKLESALDAAEEAQAHALQSVQESAEREAQARKAAEASRAEAAQARADLAVAMKELEVLRLSLHEASRVPVAQPSATGLHHHASMDQFESDDDDEEAEMGEVVDAAEVLWDTSSEEEAENGEDDLIPLQQGLAGAGQGARAPHSSGSNGHTASHQHQQGYEVPPSPKYQPQQHVTEVSKPIPVVSGHGVEVDFEEEVSRPQTRAAPPPPPQEQQQAPRTTSPRHVPAAPTTYGLNHTSSYASTSSHGTVAHPNNNSRTSPTMPTPTPTSTSTTYRTSSPVRQSSASNLSAARSSSGSSYTYTRPTASSSGAVPGPTSAPSAASTSAFDAAMSRTSNSIADVEKARMERAAMRARLEEERKQRMAILMSSSPATSTGATASSSSSRPSSYEQLRSQYSSH
eukprot:PhM_4_TR4326/c0_g1_i3/m.71562